VRHDGHLLELTGIGKHFGGLYALSGLDLYADEGEIVSVIGPNGAGKSTMFNVVTGLYPPDDGDVRFRGESIVGLAPNRITRLGRYSDVMEGIDAARAAGLSPIKINVVVMRQINDDEALDFARSTYEQDWEVRFIELMPFLEEQETCIKDTSLVLGFVPTEEIKQQIERELGILEPSQTKMGHGPARYFKLPGAKGIIGFISPVTESHFCETCNRMRLTADGKIRPCLLTDHEVDLKAILRGGGDDEAVREGILAALRTKPDAHHMSDGNRPRWRKMIQIGG